MVQILPEVPSFGKQFSQNLGAGLTQGVTQGVDFAQKMAFEKYRRGLDIKRAQADLSARTGKPTGQTLSGDIPKGGAGEQLPQSVTGAPSSATPSIMNPEQMKQAAAERTQHMLEQGVVTDYNEQLQNIRQEQQDVMHQRALQQQYGQAAENALSKVMPDATDEHKAILAKRAEALQGQNLSEADIQRRMATEAAKFKNQISSVQRSLPPKRTWNRIKEGFLGPGRTAEKARTSIKNKLKPLLNEGLYDTARAQLSEVGYAPEEVESLVSDLGESTKKQLIDFPSVKKQKQGTRRSSDITKALFSEREQLDPERQEKFNSNLKSVLTSDPNANLILLRKAYEDKGVDWRSFKDGLDQMVANGEVNINGDQAKALDLLDQPPLDRLDKILHGLNLIGR